MPRSEAELGAALLIDVSLDFVQRDVWPSICRVSSIVGTTV
jgi:hypothetical protein